MVSGLAPELSRACGQCREGRGRSGCGVGRQPQPQICRTERSCSQYLACSRFEQPHQLLPTIVTVVRKPPHDNPRVVEKPPEFFEIYDRIKRSIQLLPG
jgi:hypothetical protein